MNNIIKKTNGSSTAPMASFSGIVDQLFENNLNHLFDDRFWGTNDRLPMHYVPANIRETDKFFELQLAAPGLNKEEFRLNVSGDLLTVSYEHKEESDQGNTKSGAIRREFQRRSFSRSFNLDDSIDAGKISARYQDGILHITLPKKEGTQKISRSISIE